MSGGFKEQGTFESCLFAIDSPPTTHYSPLISDGGIGTALLVHKHPELAIVDLMNLLQPAAVSAMHQAFFDAGSQLLTTNTFCCDPDSLNGTGFSAETLCYEGAKLAREVAGTEALVAGSLGPGWHFPAHDSVDQQALCLSYTERARGLLRGAVDWLWIETVQDPLQAEIAVKGCQIALSELGLDVPIAINFSLTSADRLMGGQSIEGVCKRLNRLPVQLLGVNCSLGPDSVQSALNWIRTHSDKQLACYPNAGPGPGEYLSPEDFAIALSDIANLYQPEVIGGCCGVTTAHIQALVQQLKKTKGEE